MIGKSDESIFVREDENQVSTKAISHAPRKKFSTAFKNEIARHGALYIMLLLPVAVLIAFRYVPMYGVQIAFRNFRITRAIEDCDWVGFKYVKQFFDAPQFWQILRNTLLINLYSLATFPLSLIFALLLNYVPFKRFRKTVQMVSYAPHFISTVVMCTLILQFLNARGGIINVALGYLGVPATNYMAQSEYFYSIYVWSGVWQELGYGAIIYIASLASVSPELHEAAIVDGASIVKRIWHVDIPGVLPTFCILLIMRCGSLLNIGFEKVLLLQNNLNSGVSEVIATYVYKVGIASGRPRYSYSAAIGLFQSLFNMVMLVLVNKVTGKLSGSSLF